MLDALSHPFFLRALAAGLLVSVACGVVGTYIAVKRISSISGSLSHAAFGGVGLGYFAGFSPMLGAAGFALASSVVLGFTYRRMRDNLDALLSMLWSLGMATGMLFIALTPGYAPDLMSYLIGSILFVPQEFLWFTLALDGAVILCVALLFKELQAVSFDEEYADLKGVPVDAVLQVLLALIAFTVVILIRVVGAILVIALLSFPSAIARHFAERLVPMMVLSTTLSAFSTTAGLFVSFWLSQSFNVQVPTGPLIILIAALLYALSAALKLTRDRRSRGEKHPPIATSAATSFK